MGSVALRKIDTRRFRVPGRRSLSLSRFDPADTTPFETEQGANRLLARAVRRLYRLTLMWIRPAPATSHPLVSAAYRILLDEHERRLGRLAIGYNRSLR